MKKILLTILLITSQAFAFDNYMLISNEPVKSVSAENSAIVDVNALYTIDNQKKFIIVNPKAAGKTKILVNFFAGQKKINIKIGKESVKFDNHDGFTIFLMDTPPSEIYIPKPPADIILPKPPRRLGDG